MNASQLKIFQEITLEMSVYMDILGGRLWAYGLFFINCLLSLHKERRHTYNTLPIFFRP